jgi:hypothetical protein
MGVTKPDISVLENCFLDLIIVIILEMCVIAKYTCLVTKINILRPCCLFVFNPCRRTYYAARFGCAQKMGNH